MSVYIRASRRFFRWRRKEGGAPGSDGKMKSKRLWLALALGLILALLCGSVALAAEDSLKFDMELSDNRFTEPKTITVSITVTNAGEGDLPGPVTLYYPSGKQVEEFGSPTLTVGASRNWSGPWTPTREDLETGYISFTVRYSTYDDSGELKNYAKRIKKRIQYSGAEPELSVERTITPGTARKGQEVSVIYEITNTGDTDVTGVTIKENTAVSAASGMIDSIPAGQTERYVFTVKMGTKDITSAATLSYKAGGKTYTSKVDAATVKYGEVKLSATLTADKKGGAPGDTVKLSLALKNTDKADYKNVTVTDETLGVVFEGETVPAGSTKTLEKDLTITESQDLLFTVQAEDGNGNKVETATGQVKIIATDPTQQVILSVEATADRTQVYRIPGGVVRFTITVNNDSAVEVKNISVKAVDVTLYTFASIPAGESRSVTRDTEISMPGNFQFTANAQDQLGQTVTFVSNTIPIAYAAPTPVPTEAPLVTPPAPATEPMPEATAAPTWIRETETLAENAKWILAGVAGVLCVLLLIGAVRRGRSKAQSNKAMDHLEGATYRDYSAAPRGRRRSEITSGAEEPRDEKTAAAPGAKDENTVQNSELMAETLRRLYNDPDQGESAEEKSDATGETVTPETAEEAADRPETKTEAETEAPQAEETTPAAEEAKVNGPDRRRRSRRVRS